MGQSGEELLSGTKIDTEVGAAIGRTTEIRKTPQKRLPVQPVSSHSTRDQHSEERARQAIQICAGSWPPWRTHSFIHPPLRHADHLLVLKCASVIGNVSLPDLM
ncbi:unnamed protein product [Calypogeia fissa]